ncbi:serine hydrolase domain-containing protein [Microbispora sp. NBRC 16548]|uniref:serine hydrolase domain-containing protein n=1 Tax=Microbispora sp. NBRC 16548 TaxID=3030994 RepID=UPI0024A43615|nr:serine hydrolase domain-containing protein [Microbispora sp. NBRC 16548]GLX09082.1 D-alanyl-D-alanine carboxypeptidase [Microbispora sp. NBRC 16548]
MGVIRCRTITLRLLTVSALLLGAAPVAPAPGAADPGRRPRDAEAALGAVLDRAVSEGSPGALAQVSRAGGTTTVTRGFADTGTRRRPRADMRFRIGSTTKTFVATVVLQLVAEGRLRLDDTVERWLPGLVTGTGNDGRAITIRMLLNHTSGLFNYTKDERVPEGLERDPLTTFTPRRLVGYALSHPPVFRPGTSWEYSNTNYVLLAMIIKRVTGHAYSTEITTRVLRPLGLRATYFPGTSPDVRAPFIHAYSKDGLSRFNPSWAWAAGEMVSTVGDLNRFDSALLSGRLLPAPLMREMLTPVLKSDVFHGPGPYRYGLGVMMVTLPCGVTVYGHGGTIFGSLTWMAGTRDGRHTLSFDLNGDKVNQGELTTAANIAEFCPATPVPSQPSAPRGTGLPRVPGSEGRRAPG